MTKIQINGNVFKFDVQRDKLIELMAQAVRNNQFYPFKDLNAVNDKKAFDTKNANDEQRIKYVARGYEILGTEETKVEEIRLVENIDDAKTVDEIKLYAEKNNITLTQTKKAEMINEIKEAEKKTEESEGEDNK